VGQIDVAKQVSEANETKRMKKAAIYARVSSERQRREGTIESQIAELKRQVAANGDVLVKEYIDDGFSGAKLDRPGLDQLRSDLKTDLFEVVYFLNTDRIAREVTYQTIIVGEILKQNKQVIINGKDYVHNPENKFTLTVLGAVAELERAKIIERYSRGRIHALRQGRLISTGHRVLGYDYIPRGLKPAQLVINKREAKVVQYIFKAYAENGASKSGIIRYLEEHNMPTKTGKTTWEWKNLENVLKNYSYAGTKFFNTKTLVKNPSNPMRKLKYGKAVFRDRSEWLPVKVPAIVSKELFNKVQERFARNRQKYTSPNETQLLSTLVKCGSCGGSYSGYRRFARGYSYHKGSRGIRTGKIYHRISYICSRRVRQKLHSKKAKIKRCSNPEVVTHRLESCVLSMVSEIMVDEHKLKGHLVGFKIKKTSRKIRVESRLKNIEQKIVEIGANKRHVLALYAQGEVDRSEYSKRCLQHDQEISKAKNERKDLLSTMPALHQDDIVDASLKRYCNTLKTRFEGCTEFESKRQLLLDYIQQVAFNSGKVELHGSVPIHLKAYEDSEQTSEARKIDFSITAVIEK